MTSLTRLMTALSVALLPGFALGHDYTLGDLHVAHPHAGTTASSAMAGAGYMTILNSGAADDVLIGVEAAYPRVMMHDSTVTDGVARMQALDRVIVPAGETVTFAPGGKHVMFMGLNGDPLDAGEEVPATLIFENAGRLDVVFKVEDVTGTMDHGTMTHDMPASE